MTLQRHLNEIASGKGRILPAPTCQSRKLSKYDEEKVVLEKYTIVEADRIRTVYNWLQYVTSEELERAFAAGGFSVEALYSDVAGTPYDRNSSEFAVIAKTGASEQQVQKQISRTWAPKGQTPVIQVAGA